MGIRNLTQYVPALTLAAAVALPLAAHAQNQPQSDERDNQESREGDDKKKQEGEDQPRELEVFELEHRNPQQLNQIIVLAERTSASAHAAPGHVRPGQPGATTPGRTTAGYRGTTGDKDKVVTAVNAEEKILFVRGSEDQIEKVKELVEAFDVENQELKRHEYHGVRLIPVRSSDAQQVQSTLAQLNLQGQMLQMGYISLIAFHGDDTNKEKVEQAEEVIQKLKARAKDAGDSSESNNGDNNGDE